MNFQDTIGSSRFDSTLLEYPSEPHVGVLQCNRGKGR